MPAQNQTSTVQQITAAVQAAIAGISQQGGFATAQVTVEDFPPALGDDMIANVLIGVFLAGVNIGESEIRSLTGKNTFDSPTDVIVAVKSFIRTSVNNAEQDKQNLVRDIQQAVFADRTLGIPPSVNGTVSLETITFQNFAYAQTGNGVVVEFDALIRVHCLTNPATP